MTVADQDSSECNKWRVYQPTPKPSPLRLPSERWRLRLLCLVIEWAGCKIKSANSVGRWPLTNTMNLHICQERQKDSPILFFFHSNNRQKKREIRKKERFFGCSLIFSIDGVLINLSNIWWKTCGEI